MMEVINIFRDLFKGYSILVFWFPHRESLRIGGKKLLHSLENDTIDFHVFLEGVVVLI